MDNIYIISALVLTVISIVLYIFVFSKKDDFHNYTEDFLYEVPWRWQWKKDEIVNLTCHCPKCEQTLVYENDFVLHKTYFLCQECNVQRAVIGGGESKYAFGIIKREILRKIRTKEYINLVTKR